MSNRRQVLNRDLRKGLKRGNAMSKPCRKFDQEVFDQLVKRLRILLADSQFQAARDLFGDYLDGATQKTSWEFGTDLSEMDLTDTLEMLLRQAGYQTIGSLLSINVREAREICAGHKEIWREIREAIRQAHFTLKGRS